MPRRSTAKRVDRPVSFAERVARAQARQRRLEYLVDPALTQRRGRSRDPFASGLLDNGFQGQLLPPHLLLSETKQYMARRSPTVNTILLLRMNAIADFAHPPQFDGDTGFAIVPKDNPTHQMTAVEQREAERIRDFLLYTGLPEGRWWRDSFRIALQKLFYNTFVFDAMAIELVVNEAGQLAEWYVQDGGSIRLTDPRVYLPQTDIGKKVAPIRYIQTVLDMVTAEWNQFEMIYGVRNPSPVINQNGYGMPELESLVEMVTIEIEAITYAHRQLSQGSMPNGFVAITTSRTDLPMPELAGEATGQGTEDFARAWRNELAGPENAGKLAYLKLEPGEDIKFFPGIIPKDMPFMQLLEVAHNTICMTYGANPAEIPTIYGTMRSPGFAIKGPSPSDRRESKSEGLKRFLNAIRDQALNPLIQRLNPDFELQWVGIDLVQERNRLDYEVEMLKNGLTTLNELRVVRNWKPYDAWWADVPLIPAILPYAAQEHGVVPPQAPTRGPQQGPLGPKPDPRSELQAERGAEAQWK